MKLSGNPFEDLKPVVVRLPPLDLPILVPAVVKNGMDEILPERGSGLTSGNASAERRMDPRNDIERFVRHFFSAR